MTTRSTVAALAGVATGTVTQRLVRAGLDEYAPGGPQAWQRTNHHGRTVSLMGGPALVGALVTGTLAEGILAGRPRLGTAAALAAAGAGAAGLNDDLREDTGQRDKGLRGHLGALRRGRLTTGATKVLGIGAAAVVAAGIAGADRRRHGGDAGSVSAAGRIVDLALDSVLVAGTANLVNLFDLRPGRALKVGMIGAAGVAAAAGPALGATLLGAANAALPEDLAELDMLGDSGANALGAAVGVGLTQAPRAVRAGVAAGVVGLTLASEKVSFSAVIARTPVLAAIDAWGRRS